MIRHATPTTPDLIPALESQAAEMRQAIKEQIEMIGPQAWGIILEKVMLNTRAAPGVSNLQAMYAALGAVAAMELEIERVKEVEAAR